MRKLIPFIFMLIVGCSNKTTQVGEDKISLQGHHGNFMVTRFEFDGCEYTAFGSGNGLSVTHKGNCKYCIARQKKMLKESR